MIISEPFGSPEKVIAVPFSSKKPGSDITVELSPGDHDFINKQTVLNFAFAREWLIERIMTRISERDFEPRESLQEDVVKKIRQGLMDSPFTPRDIKKIFADSVEHRSSGQAVDPNNPIRE